MVLLWNCSWVGFSEVPARFPEASTFVGVLLLVGSAEELEVDWTTHWYNLGFLQHPAFVWSHLPHEADPLFFFLLWVEDAEDDREDDDAQRVELWVV